MQIFHAFADLVHNVAIVQIFEDFLTNSVMEISFHEFEYKVEIFIVICSDDVVEFDDVGVG